MSLGDLVPVILETYIGRPSLSRAERARRWAKENRRYLTTYKRKWRQKRREKGLPVT